MDNVATPEFATVLADMEVKQKEMLEEVSKANELATLAKHDGWKIIEEVIKQQIDLCQFYPISTDCSMEIAFFKMHAFGYMKRFGELLLNTVKMAELNEQERIRQLELLNGDKP